MGVKIGTFHYTRLCDGVRFVEVRNENQKSPTIKRSTGQWRCGLIAPNARTWTWSWHRKKAGAHPYRGQNPWPPVHTRVNVHTYAHPRNTHDSRFYRGLSPNPQPPLRLTLWNFRTSNVCRYIHVLWSWLSTVTTHVYIYCLRRRTVRSLY